MKTTQSSKMILITIGIAIVVGAGSFVAGMKFQQKRIPTMMRQFAGQGQGGQMFGRGQGGNRLGIRPVSGEILSSDDKSLTVKLSDGSSKIIVLSSTTTINKADTATKADLKTGEKVAVFGQENTDGSVTAQSIQLNPITRMGGNPSALPVASPTTK